MQTRYYIRAFEYREGQRDRLEGGYEKEVQATLDEDGNLVLGNPKWERLILNREDLHYFFTEKGLTIGVRPGTVAVDQGGNDTRD